MSIGCRFCRWSISSSIDKTTPLPRLAQHHVNGCPECRDFAAVAKTLGDRLVMDAASPDQTQAETDWLHSRIMSATVLAPVSHRSRPFATSPAWGVAIATAACMCIALGFSVLVGSTGRNAPGRSDVNSASHLLSAVYDPVANEVDKILQGLPPAPIQGEINNLVADSVAAGNFIVACLPIQL